MNENELCSETESDNDNVVNSIKNDGVLLLSMTLENRSNQLYADAHY